MPALGLGIGLPFQSKTRGESALAAITRLNLSSGLKLCLDAGDAASYPGTGQSWLDVSGQANNFFLGANNTVTTDDPSFSGTPGGLTANESFTLEILSIQ